MKKHVQPFDLIRSFTIIFVFLAHILSEQLSNAYGLVLVKSFSPGLTMSLLGFTSAALLATASDPYGQFLVKRLSRIYTSLVICISLILIHHSVQGKDVFCQHTLLHLMGLSAFFDMFLVENKATIGFGLWFITAIILMYALLPMFVTIFKHPRGKIHLVLLVVFFTALDFIMYGTESFFNVCISFSLGVYMKVNGLTEKLTSLRLWTSLAVAVLLILVCVLATSRVIPFFIRGLLFAFYPIGFVPLFFYLSERLPALADKAVFHFSSLSYEFYILHLYFINAPFYDIFPKTYGPVAMISVSFSITIALAFICARLAKWARGVELDYFLNRGSSRR